MDRGPVSQLEAVEQFIEMDSGVSVDLAPYHPAQLVVEYIISVEAGVQRQEEYQQEPVFACLCSPRQKSPAATKRIASAAAI